MTASASIRNVESTTKATTEGSSSGRTFAQRQGRPSCRRGSTYNAKKPNRRSSISEASIARRLRRQEHQQQQEQQEADSASLSESDTLIEDEDESSVSYTGDDDEEDDAFSTSSSTASISSHPKLQSQQQEQHELHRPLQQSKPQQDPPGRNKGPDIKPLRPPSFYCKEEESIFPTAADTIAGATAEGVRAATEVITTATNEASNLSCYFRPIPPSCKEEEDDVEEDDDIYDEDYSYHDRETRRVVSSSFPVSSHEAKSLKKDDDADDYSESTVSDDYDNHDVDDEDEESICRRLSRKSPCCASFKSPQGRGHGPSKISATTPIPAPVTKLSNSSCCYTKGEEEERHGSTSSETLLSLLSPSKIATKAGATWARANPQGGGNSGGWGGEGAQSPVRSLFVSPSQLFSLPTVSFSSSSFKVDSGPDLPSLSLASIRSAVALLPVIHEPPLGVGRGGSSSSSDKEDNAKESKVGTASPEEELKEDGKGLYLVQPNHVFQRQASRKRLGILGSCSLPLSQEQQEGLLKKTTNRPTTADEDLEFPSFHCSSVKHTHSSYSSGSTTTTTGSTTTTNHSSSSGDDSSGTSTLVTEMLTSLFSPTLTTGTMDRPSSPTTQIAYVGSSLMEALSSATTSSSIVLKENDNDDSSMLFDPAVDNNLGLLDNAATSCPPLSPTKSKIDQSCGSATSFMTDDSTVANLNGSYQGELGLFEQHQEQHQPPQVPQRTGLLGHDGDGDCIGCGISCSSDESSFIKMITMEHEGEDSRFSPGKNDANSKARETHHKQTTTTTTCNDQSSKHLNHNYCSFQLSLNFSSQLSDDDSSTHNTAPTERKGRNDSYRSLPDFFASQKYNRQRQELNDVYNKASLLSIGHHMTKLDTPKDQLCDLSDSLDFAKDQDQEHKGNDAEKSPKTRSDTMKNNSRSNHSASPRIRRSCRPSKEKSRRRLLLQTLKPLSPVQRVQNKSITNPPLSAPGGAEARPKFTASSRDLSNRSMATTSEKIKKSIPIKATCTTKISRRCSTKPPSARANCRVRFAGEVDEDRTPLVTIHEYRQSHVDDDDEIQKQHEFPKVNCDSILGYKLDHIRLSSQFKYSRNLSDDADRPKERVIDSFGRYGRRKHDYRDHPGAIMLELHADKALQAKCRSALTDLYSSHATKNTESQNEIIENSLSQLCELYVVPKTNGLTKSGNVGTSKKQASFRSLSSPFLSDEEHTLRGLEALLCLQLVGGLRSRHVHNVLAATTTTANNSKKLRQVSLLTSRPLRHVALQMAQYDTREALKAVLSSWK
ncbi:hypothetical protein ACA910_020328 [Epithemia clementina (nom. ined.)]